MWRYMVRAVVSAAVVAVVEVVVAVVELENLWKEGPNLVACGSWQAIAVQRL